MFAHPDDPNGQQQDSGQDMPGLPPAPNLSGDPGSGTLPEPQVTAPSPAALDTPAPVAGPVSPAGAAAPEGLLDLKQQALQQLNPLLGHLNQTPEEEFRTTMMMIQAADDQSLVQKAYDAALKIEDEKTKAQALLDIVNEINYFTQHKDEPKTE